MKIRPHLFPIHCQSFHNLPRKACFEIWPFSSWTEGTITMKGSRGIDWHPRWPLKLAGGRQEATASLLAPHGSSPPWLSPYEAVTRPIDASWTSSSGACLASSNWVLGSCLAVEVVLEGETWERKRGRAQMGERKVGTRKEREKGKARASRGLKEAAAGVFARKHSGTPPKMEVSGKREVGETSSPSLLFLLVHIFIYLFFSMGAKRPLYPSLNGLKTQFFPPFKIEFHM